MLPIGLLPALARAFSVTLPTAGLLLSAYALVVTLAGPPMTALVGRVPRKRLLLLLAAALAVTAGLAALAQTFALLLVARLLNALAHGVFWSIVASSATSIVPEPKRGSALAIVYAGSSIGIIGGVPLATFVGQTFGWQSGFLVVFAVAVLAFGALFLVGDVPAARPSSLTDISDLLTTGSFVRLLLATTLVVIGHFTAFSYFAPLLVRDDASRAGGVPFLLLVFGVAGFLSNFAFGTLAQRRGVLAIALAASLMVAALAVLAFDRNGTTFGAAALIAIVIVWGAGTGGVVVALQTRVLAAEPNRPDVASALNSSAFNLGIGGGAFVGGIAIRIAGLGVLPVVAAVLIVPAIFLQLGPVIGTVRARRRAKARPEA